MSTAKCQETAVAAAHNQEPLKLRNIRIHQYDQTKGCCSGFKACRVQVWPQFWAISVPL